MGCAKIKKMEIRVRIAPSPTGLAHVGNVYVAIFNYAFAKKNKGKFILRIEDTDIKRHNPKAEKVIFDAFEWLGLDYDEGPYRQSERLNLYQKYAQELIKQKLAYQNEGAVRFKVSSGKTNWDDLVRGKIEFQNDQIKDFVILKSDGYPTYNFAVVIDDWLMKISHVIRAEEHISNTPRQIMIYQALGAKLPQFAHLPLLRNADHSKISKRKNPVAISWYQKQGYLPEALVNFLCLLGWSHPKGKDVFSIKEFIKYFSFDRVSTSAPIFDLKKLGWLNGVYIRQKTDKELVQLISAKGGSAPGGKSFAPKGITSTLIGETIPLIKERIFKLADYPSLIEFLVKEPKLDVKLLLKKSRQNKKLIKKQFELVLQELPKVEKWQAEELEKLFRGIAVEQDYHLGKFLMAIRIALTGKPVTPPLFESMALLGKKEVLKRLKKV